MTTKFSIIGYGIFWAVMFFFNSGPQWENYSTSSELIITIGILTFLQYFTSFITLKYLIPAFLFKHNKPDTFKFFLFLFSLIFIVAEIDVLIRYYYIEPTYEQTYSHFLTKYGDLTITQRMFSLWGLKYIIFTKLPFYFLPNALLTAYSFHLKQEDLLKLKQQKSKAELEALKNQLNPHFIFNTLNNLYALALKKSDQTPMVIEKLSNILDYILYRCNDKYVSLPNEITLIKNYIDLEKIRYGKRMEVIFSHDVKGDVRIAPLILLTLLENACKHSTSEELNKSTIMIDLKTTESQIHFTIKNSKPKIMDTGVKKVNKIGLANMRKQLNLLYPNSHELKVTQDEQSYSVELRVKSR